MKTLWIWSPTGNVAGPTKTIEYHAPLPFKMRNDQKVGLKRTDLLRLDIYQNPVLVYWL